MAREKVKKVGRRRPRSGSRVLVNKGRKLRPGERATTDPLINTVVDIMEARDLLQEAVRRLAPLIKKECR